MTTHEAAEAIMASRSADGAIEDARELIRKGGGGKALAPFSAAELMEIGALILAQLAPEPADIARPEHRAAVEAARATREDLQGRTGLRSLGLLADGEPEGEGTPPGMRVVYRIQPRGLGIMGHCSETSCGDLDEGPHVFTSLAEAARAIRGWLDEDDQPELGTIQCDEDALADNEDFEGMVLVEGRGTIVARQAFADWDAMRAWFEAHRD